MKKNKKILVTSIFASASMLGFVPALAMGLSNNSPKVVNKDEQSSNSMPVKLNVLYETGYYVSVEANLSTNSDYEIKDAYWETSHDGVWWDKISNFSRQDNLSNTATFSRKENKNYSVRKVVIWKNKRNADDWFIRVSNFIHIGKKLKVSYTTEDLKNNVELSFNLEYENANHKGFVEIYETNSDWQRIGWINGTGDWISVNKIGQKLNNDSNRLWKETIKKTDSTRYFSFVAWSQDQYGTFQRNQTRFTVGPRQVKTNLEAKVIFDNYNDATVKFTFNGDLKDDVSFKVIDTSSFATEHTIHESEYGKIENIAKKISDNKYEAELKLTKYFLKTNYKLVLNTKTNGKVDELSTTTFSVDGRISKSQYVSTAFINSEDRAAWFLAKNGGYSFENVTRINNLDFATEKYLMFNEVFYWNNSLALIQKEIKDVSLSIVKMDNKWVTLNISYIANEGYKFINDSNVFTQTLSFIKRA